MAHFNGKDPVRSHLNFRDIDISDLPEATNIYNYYVNNTAVTFDTQPFTTEQRLTWFENFTSGTAHQCLVVEERGEILGYASSSTFRPKPAYHQSVETTIYLKPDTAGRGIGKMLYQKLIGNLIELNLHRAYGIVALPNPASVALHQTLGFRSIGTLTEVGYKFGQYYDTLWLEKDLKQTTHR